MTVFKRVKCANKNCKKTFLVLLEDVNDWSDGYTMVCGTEKPNCKKRYEESLRPEIEVVE